MLFLLVITRRLPGRVQAGELARSSGRMALAAYERTVQVNERYHLSDRVSILPSRHPRVFSVARASYSRFLKCIRLHTRRIDRFYGSPVLAAEIRLDRSLLFPICLFHRPALAIQVPVPENLNFMSCPLSRGSRYTPEESSVSFECRYSAQL